jgi:putative methionine-R-sulfoxide reductase with GAF domain
VLDLQQKERRARGLARQATEERQRLERMLADAKENEHTACNAALKAEMVVMVAQTMLGKL